MAIFNNKKEYLLPEVFQKDKPSNRKAEDIFNAGGILLGIVVGLGQVFKGLTQVNEEYAKHKRR